ncbi:general substrate transporter [Apiospora phragmitis]|uniref:General substrate transporter n=1 Tax=Apiospora phragmitis TaxID=2905665 RepID=A0ABR1SUD3_9PEZI
MAKHKVFSKTFLTSIFLGIGGFLYGYDSGIITPSLALRSFNQYFGNPDPSLRGAIVSIYQAGAWFGSASVGLTSDRFGRRKAILFGCIWGIIGGAVMAGSAHVAMLVLGRLLVGFAVGTITGVAPVYAAEIAKTHERARLTAVNQMMVAWGFFIALWTGVGEGRWNNPNQWRLGFAVQGIPALLLAGGVLFLNESPRWLLLKGRTEEAEVAFRNYHYSRAGDDEWCRSEFAMMQVNIAEEVRTQHQLSWGDLLKTPAFRRRLFVGSFVWAAAINYDKSQQVLIGGLYGTIGPIACIASLFFVDRIPRKTILVSSSALLSQSFLVITVIAAVFPARPGMPTNAAAQRGLIACIFAASANFSALLGPMTWIIPPEIFTTELRAKANAIVQVIHYSISLIITQCSPIALAAVGWKYYIMFILTNALCALVFFVAYPEMKGKSLEEIAELFGDVDTVHKSDIGEIEEKAVAKTDEYRRSRDSLA